MANRPGANIPASYDGITVADFNQDMNLRTQTDSKIVKINSREYAQASGGSIALQAKPNQTVTTTGSVEGAEFQPRVAANVNAANIIGAIFEPILKGATSTSTISSDLQGIQCNFSDEGSVSTTVSGDIAAVRCYLQIAGTVTGEKTILKVEESGTNKWTALAKLPDDDSIAHSTKVSATGAGYIRVKVGSAVRYITLTSGAPA